MSELAWEPQPQQFKLLAAKHIPVVFFGGARGGGKTDALLADFAQDVGLGSEWSGLYLRQTYPQLQEAMKRFCKIYEPTGMKWYKTEKRGVWPNGAELVFKAVNSWDDLQNLQGWNRPWVGLDEATNYADEKVIRGIFGLLRNHKHARYRLSGNPGGPSHAALKAWFIDPAPLGEKVFHVDLPVDEEGNEDNFVECMFIPSKVQDNPALLKNDPNYIKRLRMLGSDDLIRAWLYGDWNVTLGGYFGEFSKDHIIAPFEIPSYWTRFRAIDWGIYHPAACLWFAVADALLSPTIPDGSLIVYRELYTGDASDKGTGMLAGEFAEQIATLSNAEEVLYTVADPSCLPQRGPVVRGPSIAETFQKAGVLARAADNNRITGWGEVRQRLRGKTLFVFSTCSNLIRTLPLLQHDNKKPEDLDTMGPDHLADALRYGCMSRPSASAEEEHEIEIPSLGDGMTFDQLEQLRGIHELR